jgi:hypothetical protein
MSTKYIKYKTVKNKDGSSELHMTCKICGSQIDRATDIGPMCKNGCALKKSIKKRNTICNFFSGKSN